jgi:cytochrome c556
MRSWIGLSVLLIAANVSAQERRAPVPKFSPEQLRGIFFDNLSDGLRGERPSLSSLRDAGATPRTTATLTPDLAVAPDDPWSQWIGPAAIEDEVKRMKLHFDSIVTTPSAFSGGGYQEARIDLTVLATLFAVISEHRGDVRWKQHAVPARELVARTAFNCKTGSRDVFREAKSRKADLQDLLSGSGLTTAESEAATDWSQIADREPLMEYAESLIESLAGATNDAGAIKREPELISRNAELIAMLGEVLSQPGMDDADDEDYAKLSKALSGSAKELALAIERSDVKEIQTAVGNIRKRCDACHEQYQ